MFTANNGRRISKIKSLPRWQENIQTSQMTGKEKVVIEIITIRMTVAAVITMETLFAEDAEEVEDVEETVEVAVGEKTIVSIWKMLNVSIVARKATIRLIVPSRRRTIKAQTWFRKMISKPVSNFNEGNVHKEGQESKDQR
jgi:hypothetical protein